jgi:hypothetical protein
MAPLLPVQAYNQTPATQQAKRERKEQVATGVGGAAGLGTATKMASKRGLLTKGKTLQNMLDAVTTTAGNVTKNAEATSSLFGKFKANVKIFTRDILSKYKALENSRFVGAIVKNPIVKKSAGIFGSALAFFVLVTGANKTIKTGSVAYDDVKNKINILRESA